MTPARSRRSAATARLVVALALVLRPSRGAVRSDFRRRRDAGADRRVFPHGARARSAKSMPSSMPRSTISSMSMRAAGCCNSRLRCIVAVTAGTAPARFICSPRPMVSRSPATSRAGHVRWTATTTGSSSRSMPAKPVASSPIRCARRSFACPAIAAAGRHGHSRAQPSRLPPAHGDVLGRRLERVCSPRCSA